YGWRARLCAPAACQLRRQQHRCDHTLWVGQAFARDVKGGAVIDRRADDRQPERDVDRLPEGDELHRYEPLVVVTGDDDVEVAAAGADENGVAGKRPLDVQGARATRHDRRAET